MRSPRYLPWIFLTTLFFVPRAVSAADSYSLGPESQTQPGVPTGRIESFSYTNSNVFPGTQRDVSVYIPAQYQASQPAALMVFQDGQAYVNSNGVLRVPTVFDNLIHRKEIPVTIGVFVNPGTRNGQSNRSFEYDSPGDAYAKFLIEELLPHIQQKYMLSITADPKKRAICGMSSGAICAFTVAWERPDSFQKVLSHIGSYVNIRGGHVYPALIRKTERKPIRIFLQEGKNDLNNLHGDWPLANQAMASALLFAGYDFKLVMGDGSHNGKHGGAILPESLRWLWRPEMSPPAPLTRDNLAGDEALTKVLLENEPWEKVAGGFAFTDGACHDREGNFYFSNLPKGTLHRILPNGSVETWLEAGPKISGLKSGHDGSFYAATQGDVNKPNAKKKIIAIDPRSKKIRDLAVDVQANDLAVSKDWLYFTDTAAGQVVMVPLSANEMSRPRVAAGGIDRPNGITLSPDGKFLFVSEYRGSNVWSFVVDADGALSAGERYMTLALAGEKKESGGDGMTADREGRYYVTSHAGIQMFDSLGRLGGVISLPENKGFVSLAFAGKNGHWLYACGGDTIWRRKLAARGLPNDK